MLRTHLARVALPQRPCLPPKLLLAHLDCCVGRPEVGTNAGGQEQGENGWLDPVGSYNLLQVVMEDKLRVSFISCDVVLLPSLLVVTQEVFSHAEEHAVFVHQLGGLGLAGEQSHCQVQLFLLDHLL